MDAHAREPSGGVESAEDGFLSRASRGSVAFRVGESRRARRSTPSPVSSLEFQTVHRPTTQQATSNLAPRAEIFFLHAKGHPHCPPRFGRGSSPPARRDGVEVGPETRDRGVRRGDARPRHRQRARAPGRSHREQVRRAIRGQRTQQSGTHRARQHRRRARPFRRRTRARVTRAAPRVGSDRQSREVETRGRSRGPTPRGLRRGSRSRADDRGNLFLFFRFATRASRPFPERRLGELDQLERAPKRRYVCFFSFPTRFRRERSLLLRPETTLVTRRHDDATMTTDLDDARNS